MKKMVAFVFACLVFAGCSTLQPKGVFDSPIVGQGIDVACEAACAEQTKIEAEICVDLCKSIVEIVESEVKDKVK